MAKANVTNTYVVPTETTKFPYYDDFNEDKNFHRILFRPGYAVQARELTQIQTILQNQVERFGRHIFVNGSSVIGGEVTFSKIRSLNLASTFANTDIDVTQFRDKTITSGDGSSNVVARVIQSTTETETDPPTIYLRYITGNEFNSGDTIKISGEEVYANVVSDSNFKANSYFGFIGDSVFFYNGFFVKVPKQNIVVGKYTEEANARVGLELSDALINSSADSSLLDPALESSNYQAPGADRYRMDLVLARRDLDSTDDEKFIEISRVENGIIKKNITTPIYSEIEEVFARRTYDESGNYTVKPFIVTIADDESDPANNSIITLSSGKAYIFGFEYETLSDTKIRIPKARTTANVLNYNLIANYGNYVIVDNLTGAFDTSGMGVADIHCIPSQFVDRTSSTTYNTTKIGTTLVKDIEFFSGDTVVADRKFEFYIFNTKFNKITGNCSSTANSTVEVVLDSSTFSANNDAYEGATIRINAGNAAGEIRTVISYNGAIKTANVDSPFSVTTDSTSNVTIEFDFGEAEGFTTDTRYTAGATTNSNCSITVLNKDNGLQNGVSYVTESRLSPLVFRYPEEYIADGTISDVSYMYRRVFTGVQFTDGNSAVLTAATNEGFEGATSSSNVASTVTDNFLVICTNNQSSSRADGEQIKVRADVTTGTPEQATLNTDGGAGDTFIATVYAKTDVSSGTQRVKTLVLANTSNFASESSANTFVGPTGSTTSVYLDTGQVVITNPTKVPNVPESLYIPDVITVKKIYDLEGASIPSAGASISSLRDVTNRYLFDTGQKDTYYDHSSIILKPGVLAPKGPLIVCCRYYKSTTDKGYFSVDSYPSLKTNIVEEGVSLGTGYSIIPKYRGVALRDTIDFRPVRRAATNNSVKMTLDGIKLPIPATDFNSDYQYYLGRYDLITLNANRSLSVIQGDPARNPQFPTAPSKSMVLNTIFVPPFTEYSSNISVEYMNTKRYTMKDINLLEQRLSAVEYYVQLTTLEKNAIDISITDVDGLERTKYGIFTDNFKNHTLGDVESSDYNIAVDVNGRYTGDGMAIPRYDYASIRLDMTGTINAKKMLDLTTLDYTEEEFLVQPTATKFTAVADYLYSTFEGTLLTSPEADHWKETRDYEIVTLTRVNNTFYKFETVYVGFAGGVQAARAWAIGEAARQFPSFGNPSAFVYASDASGMNWIVNWSRVFGRIGRRGFGEISRGWSASPSGANWWFQGQTTTRAL